MFRTLYSRLAITLFILLFFVGLILIQIIGHSSVLYQQEVSQKLNLSLAKHIVAEQPLMKDQQINHQVLDSLFHNLMVINPSIELYFLDKQGGVLGFSAPKGKVKRTQVELQPILKYLEGNTRFPIKGDDPRNLDGQKVFSAAKIISDDGLQGYLYIVLGGEQYDNVVQMIGNSFILDAALWVLFMALAAALAIGLIVFEIQTRRLRKLGHAMRSYAENTQGKGDVIRYQNNSKKMDEIDQLGRQFNDMAEKINTQIFELKRMDSMRRELVANVSHDLRTPLTTMRGYLETLKLKKNELSADEKKQYLETALSHCQHLGKLVEELFELARLDSCISVVNSEPFSMGELVQDVAQSFQLRALQKMITLEARLNPSAPMIYGDIAMMQRVLENLLENGLRHTPEGGSIRISVEVDSGKLVVQVSDTGCGIPAEDRSLVFERFYQQEGKTADNHNAGLGLAIVKRILELHGSVINVHSEHDSGTTFEFYMATQPSVTV